MTKWKNADAFRYIRQELSPEECADFEAALAENSDLRESVQAAKSVTTLIQDALPAAESLDSIKVQRTLTETPPAKEPLSRLISWQVPAFAMAAFATIMVSILVTQNAGHEPLWAWTSPPGQHTVSTQWIRLMDGSEARPGADAVWQVDEQKEDKIRLSLTHGSLELRVSKNTSRKEFKVQSQGVTTAVLGTQFVVDTDSTGRVDVNVLEGIVQVSTDQTTLQLTEGQRAHRADRDSALVMGGGTPPNTPPTKEVEPDPAPAIGVAPSLKKAAIAPQKAAKAAKPFVKKQGRSKANPAEALELEDDNPLEVIEIEIPPQHQEVASAVPTTVEPVPVQRPKAEQREETAAIIKLLQRGEAKQAISRISALLKRNPAHLYRTDLVYLKGYAHHHMGDKEKARSLWKKYESAAPNGPWLKTVGDWLHPSQPSTAKLH